MEKVSEKYISQRIEEYNSQIYVCNLYHFGIGRFLGYITRVSMIVKADNEKELLFKIFEESLKRRIYDILREFVSFYENRLLDYMPDLHTSVKHSYETIYSCLSRKMKEEKSVEDMVYEHLKKMSGDPLNLWEEDNDTEGVFIEIKKLDEVIV